MSERVTAEQLEEWKAKYAAQQAAMGGGLQEYAAVLRYRDELARAVPALIAEVERLREALSAILADMPIIDCDRLHHAKKDRHGAGPCPVETRLEAAISSARSSLQPLKEGPG